MGHQHMHFVDGLVGKEEVISGMHTTCDVYIYVDVNACVQDEIVFYTNYNAVLLTAKIDGTLPQKYFLLVVGQAGRECVAQQKPRMIAYRQYWNVCWTWILLGGRAPWLDRTGVI